MQQYVHIEGELRWRESHELPPAGKQIVSPFDLTARFSRKRTTEWVGYKVHLTETYASDHPHLITHVLTTPATETDVEQTERIHQGLEEQGRLPDVHTVDAGYTSAEQLVISRDRYQVELLGPVSELNTWQKQTGYDVRAFDIDWDNECVQCPQGHESAHWYTYGDTVRVAFSAADCQACPVRETAREVRSGRWHFRAVNNSRLCGSGARRNRRTPFDSVTTSGQVSKEPSRKGLSPWECDARAIAGWRKITCKIC